MEEFHAEMGAPLQRHLIKYAPLSLSTTTTTHQPLHPYSLSLSPSPHSRLSLSLSLSADAIKFQLEKGLFARNAPVSRAIWFNAILLHGERAGNNRKLKLPVIVTYVWIQYG